MRAKDRIRPFLDELALLWEQKPELRFGQIVAGLPRYFESPTDDLFYMEEERLSAALRRYFNRGERLQKTDVRKHERECIVAGWEELSEKLNGLDSVSGTDDFKPLLHKTWKYFMTYGDLNNLSLSDLSIISGLTRFAYFNAYPTGIESRELDACAALVKGLLFSIEKPRGGYRGNLFDGYITVEVYYNDEREVNIDELNEFYMELCETYKADSE